jgi:hypothetical protein
VWPKFERHVIPTRLAEMLEEGGDDPALLRLLSPLAVVLHARVIELTGPDQTRLIAYLSEVGDMLPSRELRGDARRLVDRLLETAPKFPGERG